MQKPPILQELLHQPLPRASAVGSPGSTARRRVRKTAPCQSVAQKRAPQAHKRHRFWWASLRRAAAGSCMPCATARTAATASSPLHHECSERRQNSSRARLRPVSHKYWQVRDRDGRAGRGGHHPKFLQFAPTKLGFRRTQTSLFSQVKPREIRLRIGPWKWPQRRRLPRNHKCEEYSGV